MVNDEMLERLGNYFVHMKIREKYGWTFYEFISKWKNNYFDHTYSNINTDCLISVDIK